MKFQALKKITGILLASTLVLGGAFTALASEAADAVAIDKEAFDELLASGIVADDADIGE